MAVDLRGNSKRWQRNVEVPRPSFGAAVVQVKVDLQFAGTTVDGVFQRYAIFERDGLFEVFAMIADVSHGSVPQAAPYSLSGGLAVLFGTVLQEQLLYALCVHTCFIFRGISHES